MMEEGMDKGSTVAVDGEGLCFHYGNRKSKPVLDGLNIRVERGIIYGLLGPSGCGKTTLLQCIVGRHKPNKGVIKIYGKAPGDRGFSIPGPGVGFMPQELALYPEITTEETLTYFGRLYQMDYSKIKERVIFLADFLNIPSKKTLIKNLSGGQQRRVSFAAALIHKPPLLILDEPTVGVDPVLRRNIWSHLQNLASKDQISIIITTHYVEEARQAQAVGMMRNGRLLAETNPELLMKQHGVFTLEEVFLKLCVADVESQEEANGSKANLNGVTICSRKRRGFEDPWIIRDRIETEFDVDSNEGSTAHEQHKSALLNDVQNVEILPRRDNESCKDHCSAANLRMAALIRKNFVRLKRNIPLLFFQLFVPTIQVIIFCLCVGGEPFDLPMAIVNMEGNDSTAYGTNYLQFVDSHVVLQKPYPNMSSAVDSVKRGESWGVVHIGPQFTESLIERYLQGIEVDNATIVKGTITLYLDFTNQQISATLYSKFSSGFQKFAETLLNSISKNPMLASPPVVMGDPIYGNAEPNFTEFMAPGMILSITYIMAVGLSAMSIIIEKKEGLLDRSWIAGVRSWEVVFSIFFVLFLVMLIQLTLVLLFTFLAFSIPSHGSLLWVIIATLLVGLEGMAYGLFISAICSDENIAIMIAMGSFYPNLLLSGIIWPTEAMPHYLRSFSYCLPLTLIANTMRSVLSRGWGIADNHIWDGYLVALAWIIPVILLSSLIFKLRK